jgi:two-component system, chemotaxis family, sensor kinase CheA
MMHHLRIGISIKLALLAGIPVLGALVLALIIVQAARENARTAESIGTIEDLAELSDRMRQVASVLQIERARTCLSRGQSLGVAKTTERERHATDAAIDRLDEFLSAREHTKLPPRLARDLDNARQRLAELKSFRSTVDIGKLSLEQLLDFYSEPTLSLIGATAALTELSTDASLLRNVASLASMMEVKERQSLQHALLAHVFAVGEYPPGIFRRLVALSTEEKVHIEGFKRSATELHHELLARAFKTSDAEAAGVIKSHALTTTEDETTTEAETWYKAQGRLIEDVGSAERELGRQVREAAAGKLLQAKHAVRIGMGLTGGVLLLSLLLAVVIGRGIAKSLAVLSDAAQRIRREQDFSVRAVRTTDDEIGALTDAFNGMLTEIQGRDSELERHRAGLEHLVHERTQQLSARNAAMRLVLDNVDQGLVTTDMAGKLSAERSLAFDRWFGSPEPGQSFASHLAASNELLEASFSLAFEQATEGFLPLDVCLDMLPKRIERDDRCFALTYSPLIRDQQLDGLLLMITEITSQVHAERAEREQRDQIRAFQSLLQDRVSFLQFLSEARSLVNRIGADEFQDDVERRRSVHTLKGNASLFGLDSIVSNAHLLEQALEEKDLLGIAQCRQTLVDGWNAYDAQLLPLLGEDLGDRVEVTRGELNGIVMAIREGAPGEIIEARVAQLAFEPMRSRFGRFAAQIKALSKRLNKPGVDVVVQDNGVRLPSDRFDPLWSAFSHLIRNIVDHGLEEPEARQRAGKPPKTQVTLAATESAHALTLVVQDNGRGIDWQRVREIAREKSMPHSSKEELVLALVSPGFSTANSVTQTSGRGVGLNAVASVVASLHGKLSIDAEWGRGTCFTFVFDR